MLARGGKTQLAKFDPKKMQDTCLLDISGMFELSQVIPEPNWKQAQNPIRPVARIKRGGSQISPHENKFYLTNVMSTLFNFPLVL